MNTKRLAAIALLFALLFLAHWLSRNKWTEGPKPFVPGPEAMAFSMHLAAASGDVRTLGHLLENGADINARDQGGLTPLHGAARFGNLGAVRLLLSREGIEIDPKNSLGYTPLCMAMMFRYFDVARELIRRGADVNSKNRAGFTMLHGAVALGRKDEAEILLEASGIDVDARSGSGLTPLHFAAQRSRMGIARLLIAGGADVNARASDGSTPLIVAIKSLDIDMALLLMRSGADADYAQEWFNKGRRSVLV